MRPTPAALLAAALLLTGCATGDGVGSSTPNTDDVVVQADGPGTSSGDEGTGDAAEQDDATPAPDPDAADLTLTAVGEGFEQPVAAVVSPDGVLWVVEQPGRITTIDGETVLDISDVVSYRGEQGLLDVVLHPDEPRLFLHHSGPDGETRLAEFALVDGGVDADSRQDLFRTAQPASNHNGGSLAFHPDATLLLALGDGGRAGDAFDQAQDTSTPLGGILRFDVSTPGEATPAGAGFDEPALWAYGLRNPWRIDIDDDRLYVADVGQDAVEEVSVVSLDEAAGANFGWPAVEGDTCFAVDPCDGDYVPPVANLRHGGADGPCSITGGVVYRGAAIPELQGTYLFADLCENRLRGLFTPDGRVGEGYDFSDRVDVSQVVGFATDADGEVLLLQLSGEVLRLEPA